MRSKPERPSPTRLLVQAALAMVLAVCVVSGTPAEPCDAEPLAAEEFEEELPEDFAVASGLATPARIDADRMLGCDSFLPRTAPVDPVSRPRPPPAS